MMKRTWARSSAVAWFSMCAFAAPMASTAYAQRSPSPGAERAAARRAAIASARGNLEAAQLRQRAAEERVRAEEKANPDNLTAQNELDDAQAQLDRVSGPVLARLRESNAEYRKLLDDEEAAARRVREEHAKNVAANPASTQPTTVPAEADPQDDVRVVDEEQSLNVPVPTDEQVVAAVDKLDVRTRRRELEREALAADPATREASDRVDVATQKLQVLRAQYEAKLLNDPEYRAARDQVTAARAELTRAASANY